MTPTEFRNTADSFTKAYVEAALWSSSAELGECRACETIFTPPKFMTEGDTCPVCKGTVSGTDLSFTERGTLGRVWSNE